MGSRDAQVFPEGPPPGAAAGATGPGLSGRPRPSVGGCKLRAAQELARPRRFLGDETHKTPELHTGAKEVSGRCGQVIPSRLRGLRLRPAQSEAVARGRPGMSPRRPVLPGPTSTERRGPDAGRGRGGEEIREGRSGLEEGGRRRALRALRGSWATCLRS